MTARTVALWLLLAATAIGAPTSLLHLTGRRPRWSDAALIVAYVLAAAAIATLTVGG